MLTKVFVLLLCGLIIWAKIWEYRMEFRWNPPKYSCMFGFHKYRKRNFGKKVEKVCEKCGKRKTLYARK